MFDINRLMSYMFDTEDEDDQDEELPYRQVGTVGKMPIPVSYDWERIVRACEGYRRHLEQHGQATDDRFISGVELARIENKSYHLEPLTADEREADRKAIFYTVRAPVLATHPEIEWVGAWNLLLDEAPATDEEFRSAASALEIPKTRTTENFPLFIEQAYWLLRELVGTEQRPVSSYELATDQRTTNGIPEAAFGKVLEFFAKLPGVEPPEHDEYLPTADGEASWRHVDTFETAEEVTDDAAV